MKSDVGEYYKVFISSEISVYWKERERVLIDYWVYYIYICVDLEGVMWFFFLGKCYLVFGKVI